MKWKHNNNLYTFYILLHLYNVNCVPLKSNKEDDYLIIEIGKELFDMELFDGEELASIPDQGNFNPIDHFVEYNVKEKDELIGFEDDFIVDNEHFIPEEEYYDTLANTEHERIPRKDYNSEYKDIVNKSLLGKYITYEYDYDKFKNEYYNIVPIEPLNIPNDTQISNFSKHDKPDNKEEMFEEQKEILLDCKQVGRSNCGWKGIKCTWYDIRQAKNSTEYHNAGLRFAGIVWFWFKVYAVIAVLLWIFKGWCCCCCICKICKTKQIIEDIKYYMITNPPGIIRHPDGKVSRYKPTNKELETFTQLEKEIYFSI